MNKPTKPNITIPESFAANGVKVDFDNNKILNGFDRIQPDVLAGDNLNKFIDDTYKGLNYGIKGVDYLEERWKSQITNCLLEVPQNIKLELNNGALIVKAGSIVAYPDGFEIDGVTQKFGYVEIDNDLTISFDNPNEHPTSMVVLTIDGTDYTFKTIEACVSGTTSQRYSLYYRTDLNKIFDYEADASTPAFQATLPLGIFNYSGASGITKIKQIFNGIGYIGSIIWVDKGVKCLIPNGRNEDGSLKNIEYKTTSLLTSLIDANWEEHTWLLDSDGTFGWYPMAGGEVHYNPETNYWEDSRYPQKKYVSIGVSKCNNDAGIITSFIPNQAFRAYNYNNNSDNPHIIRTYKRDQAWYNIYSNGWCKQGGVTSCSNTGTMKRTTTLLIPYIDTKYSVFTQGLNAQNVSDNVFISARLTNAFETYTTNVSPAGAYTNDYLWVAEGYIDLSAVL